MLWSVSINSEPSKGPSTTLVPYQLARIKAGTQESMELNCHQEPHRRGVQGELKKLAQGEVPPLLLKNVETGGPKTAFAFLKVWKLASQHLAPVL